MRCLWYAAILRATGSLRSKARWVIDTRKTSRINDLGDLTIQGDVAEEDCSRKLAIRAGVTSAIAAVPWSARGGVVRPRLDCRSLGGILIRDCPNRTNLASHCQTTFASCTGFSPRSRASYRFVTLAGFTCFYCLPGECPAKRLQCLSLASPRSKTASTCSV